MQTLRISLTMLTLAVGVSTISASTMFAADDAASSTKEAELLAVLRSDAPSAEKAIACKNLAIHGTEAAVADLAKLLPDPQLSSWSRIALEAIPGEASDKALRDAADSLEGRLLVGMLNSIGVRRDANAVDQLTGRLRGHGCRSRCGRRCGTRRIETKRNDNAPPVTGNSERSCAFSDCRKRLRVVCRTTVVGRQLRSGHEVA
ncbi:MAG: hypothetical protein R3C19_09835 [Planctomycetaceae bacterium]